MEKPIKIIFTPEDITFNVLRVLHTYEGEEKEKALQFYGWLVSTAILVNDSEARRLLNS